MSLQIELCAFSALCKVVRANIGVNHFTHGASDLVTWSGQMPLKWRGTQYSASPVLRNGRFLCVNGSDPLFEIELYILHLNLPCLSAERKTLLFYKCASPTKLTPDVPFSKSWIPRRWTNVGLIAAQEHTDLDCMGRVSAKGGGGVPRPPLSTKSRGFYPPPLLAKKKEKYILYSCMIFDYFSWMF